MRRQYLAIVERAPIADSRHVDAAIGRDPRNRLRMAVVPPPQGKPAQTDYQVLARSSAAPGLQAHAALACRLRTGRTHQIRVHLATIGHPLVGDAPTAASRGGLRAPGAARLAARLQHPATGEELAWTVRCPMISCLAAQSGPAFDPRGRAAGNGAGDWR